VIDILLEEHRNIKTLLHVLEQELNLFDQANRPDYQIFQAIIEYFQTYPENHHHPKEDVVYKKLELRDPSIAERIGDVEAEHEAETSRLRNFAQAVEDILGGRELPRQTFHNVVLEFIEHQRQHMEKEERLLFPAAVKNLRPEDWAEIDGRMIDGKDPLFDSETEMEFRKLQQTILRWEHEAQANRA
jgi:hemerythrin-like domain-containing protein